MKRMINTLATLALVLSLGVPMFAAAKSAQEAQTAPTAQAKPPATKSSKKPAKKHSSKTAAKNGNKAAASAPAATPKQ